MLTVQPQQGPNSVLLRVIQPTVLQPYGHAGKEVHHIPLVVNIVPAVDFMTKTLYIMPPDGTQQCIREVLVLETALVHKAVCVRLCCETMSWWQYTMLYRVQSSRCCNAWLAMSM